MPEAAALVFAEQADLRIRSVGGDKIIITGRVKRKITIHEKSK